ncbi:glycosyltransferase [Candidatus Peregrinibacteria bacterium]|nr:glycosyltransferase [Candidatus Peregrinibacteria bacterium]
MIKYSFIIPVKEINDYIRESVPKILEIKRDDFEVIIYPDVANGEKWAKTTQISTGSVGPAEKRTLAIRDAKGDFFVFIDDDAYPNGDFLDILDKDFEDKETAAVGGPAITPKTDSFWQKVSGAVFLSSLSCGFPERYVSIGKKREVTDWPSVNLSVRRADFVTVHGFNSKYWPGEDTLFCLDLIKKTHKKILYDPDLVVFHHRRSGLGRHLWQICQYGLHRGFFAKQFPETSFKLRYFIPSLFVLFILAGLFAYDFGRSFLILYGIGWFVYLLALVKAFWDIHKYEKNIWIGLNVVYYICFTHIFYGLAFIKGFLFTKELKSRLR